MPAYVFTPVSAYLGPHTCVNICILTPVSSSLLYICVTSPKSPHLPLSTCNITPASQHLLHNTFVLASVFYSWVHTCEFSNISHEDDYAHLSLRLDSNTCPKNTCFANTCNLTPASFSLPPSIPSYDLAYPLQVKQVQRSRVELLGRTHTPTFLELCSAGGGLYPPLIYTHTHTQRSRPQQQLVQCCCSSQLQVAH